jgi:hypothetical protein
MIIISVVIIVQWLGSNYLSRIHTCICRSTHNDEMCNFYIMFYTDTDKGEPFFNCYGNLFPELYNSMPASADVPPPSNPELEAAGDGHVHSTSGSNTNSNRGRNSANTNNNNNYENGASWSNIRRGYPRQQEIAPSQRTASRQQGGRYDGAWQRGQGRNNHEGRSYMYNDASSNDDAMDTISAEEYHDIANGRSRYRRPPIGQSDDDYQQDGGDGQSEIGMASRDGNGDQSDAGMTSNNRVGSQSDSRHKVAAAVITTTAAAAPNALGKSGAGELGCVVACSTACSVVAIGTCFFIS